MAFVQHQHRRMRHGSMATTATDLSVSDVIMEDKATDSTRRYNESDDTDSLPTGRYTEPTRIVSMVFSDTDGEEVRPGP